MSRRSTLLADRPSRVLVIAARPGDADLALAGSVARWVGEGSTAHLACCTSGDGGADDANADPLEVAALREREQRAAAARLGYESVTFLHRPDGAVANDLALREQLVRLIRALRPVAVAAPDPRDIIRAGGTLLAADVRATGEAALDAIEPARRAMAFSYLSSAEGLAPHAVSQLYLFETEHARCAIDISGTLEVKVAALREHAGLLGGPDGIEARARQEAAAAGRPLGLSAAEVCAVVDLRA